MIEPVTSIPMASVSPGRGCLACDASGAGFVARQAAGATTQEQDATSAQAASGACAACGNTPCTCAGASAQATGATPGMVDATATTATSGLSDQVRELQRRDREVRDHEQAHVAAGGQYAGGARYTMATGPDGRQYAIGGEVAIDMSPVHGDPDATIRKAQTVRKAANAPAQPSGADRQIAAQASQMEAEARLEKTQTRTQEKLDSSSGDGGPTAQTVVTPPANSIPDEQPITKRSIPVPPVDDAVPARGAASLSMPESPHTEPVDVAVDFPHDAILELGEETLARIHSEDAASAGSTSVAPDAESTYAIPAESPNAALQRRAAESYMQIQSLGAADMSSEQPTNSPPHGISASA